MFGPEPKFKTVQEEIAWLKNEISIWSGYPDQMCKLYAMSLIARLESLGGNHP